MDACTGLRVLEAADGTNAGSLCGQLFAGLDAQVVKLESAKGDVLRQDGLKAPDGTAHLFHLMSANKSLCRLSSNAIDAERQWLEWTEWADIVVLDESFQNVPGQIADAEAFCRKWPAKILCKTSIFGTDTIRKGWSGNELIAEAVSGLLLCSGYPERPPVTCGLPYALHVGGLFAFNGIMAALWDKEHTGKGQWLDLSVVGCLVGMLGNFMPSYFVNGRSPKRVGNRHIIAAPWNIYPTADGFVVICTGTGGAGWWESIAEIIERPDVAHDPRFETETKRVQNVEEVDRIISEWSSKLSSKEVEKRMTKGGIPIGESNSVEGVLADPHYRDMRALMATVQSSKGPIPISGQPFKIGSWEISPRLASSIELPRAQARDSFAVPSAAAGGKALKGLRILEFGSRTSVPMAGRILCDLGADVIKIEPPKGEGLRSAGQPIGGSSYIFHINNAGKRSLVIDPAKPEGRVLILEMAAKADVWMENLAPGVLERMGLGYEALKAVNPRIVYCSVSGFGIRSNYGDKKAFDSVVQAASGMMHMTGYPDHMPVKIGISASDLAVGVSVVGAVLGALRYRDQSQKGLHVDLAMADIGVWMTQSAWPEVFYGNGHPIRPGNRSGRACPHNLFATRDGGFVAIATETDEQWQSLLTIPAMEKLRGDASLRNLSGRLAKIDEIEKVISAWTTDLPAEDVAAELQAKGVPAAAVRDLGAIVNDPDVQNRKLIIEIEHPLAGKMKLLGNPLLLSRTPAEVSGGAPVLGQHSQEVLREWLGMPNGKIDALVQSGIVVSKPATAAPAAQTA